MAATLLLLITLLTFLGWGLYRARPYQPATLLPWFQSAVLFTPWLILLSLPYFGVMPNLALILLLIVASIGFYIFLGSRLRLIAQQTAEQVAAADLASQQRSPVAAETSLEQRQTLSAPVDSAPAENIPVDSGPDNIDAATADPADGKPASLSQPSATAPAKAASAPQPEPIPEADLAQIRSIFGVDTFFATETVPYQSGAIFKGNLRSDQPQQAHRILSERLTERLGDRYRLFLLTGPEDKPVVIVLPRSSDPPQSSPTQWGFSLLLLAATVATSLEAGGILQGFDFFNSPERFSESWPIAFAILAVLLCHEAGHWVWARRYDVRLSPPFFIPAWQIGSFGALTRFESLLPNRSVLFDIAFAGPAAGALLSLGFLLAGLTLSHPGSAFQIPAQFFQGSILVGTLARLLVGPAMQQPLVDIHPLTVIGWLGLVITAINVMPAGQLDGGRIVQAIYGRKIARITTIATLVVLAIATLANPLALYWAIVILFLQRDLERPSLEELTEPNDIRAALGLFLLFFTAAVLLPLPPSLAGNLGLGG
ncbi:MAG: site-2 protease family protein [Cyanobacteria bacterium P01_A01_bin.135]